MKGVTSKAARADSLVTWAHAPVLIGAELSAVLIKKITRHTDVQQPITAFYMCKQE